MRGRAVAALAACAVALAGAACGGDGATGTADVASPAVGIDPVPYSAMADEVPGLPPVVDRRSLPPAVTGDTVTFPIGDGRPEAHVVRAPGDDVMCLYVRGRDGVGGACSAPGLLPRGVMTMGETYAGEYVLNALVPDDITSVAAAGRRATPVRNLVRVELPFGRHDVVFRSVRGDVTMEVDARRAPGR